MNGSFGASVLSSSAIASRGVAINAARAPPTKVLRCELTDSCPGVKATFLVIEAVLLHRNSIGHLPVVQGVYTSSRDIYFPPNHFFLMKFQDAQYEAGLHVRNALPAMCQNQTFEMGLKFWAPAMCRSSC